MEEKISITDLGLEKRKPSTTETPFGKIRHWSRVELIEWIFFGISILSALLTIAFTSERLANRISPDEDDFTFAWLLLINAVFCLVYIIHGVFREDPYEIAVFILTSIVVMVYVIMNYVEEPTGIIKLVRLCITIPLSIVNIILGGICFKNYFVSKRLIFWIVGGNEELNRTCKIFFLCGSLLCFDLQLQFNVLVLVLKQGMNTDNVERIILGVGIAFSVIWTSLGYLSLRLENKTLIWIFWSFFWAGPAYVVYKFIITILQSSNEDLLYHITFLSGILAIILRIILISSTVAAYRNFGKGYKEHINTQKKFKEKALRDSYIPFPNPDTEYSTISLHH